MVRVRRRTTGERHRRVQAWRAQVWDFRWDLVKFEGIVIAGAVLALLLPTPAHELVIFEVGALVATAVWLPSSTRGRCCHDLLSAFGGEGVRLRPMRLPSARRRFAAGMPPGFQRGRRKV